MYLFLIASAGACLKIRQWLQNRDEILARYYVGFTAFLLVWHVVLSAMDLRRNPMYCCLLHRHREQPVRNAHTIQRGDTLNKISQQYGYSIEELLAANPGVDIHDLQLGTMINVPVR